MSAIAALQLVEQRKIDLDENVNTYLRTWKVKNTSFTKNEFVTLRRLLTHTAGLTVHGFQGYTQEDTLPKLVQILNGEKPANSPPIISDLVPGSLW
jgi:CubicO group peptidase (beta-lactamase class C family)